MASKKNKTEDGMPAEPDNVYLPPSDSDLTLRNGNFHLIKRPARDAVHMPVDFFLKHLAAERGERSGCVILSGTGSTS